MSGYDDVLSGQASMQGSQSRGSNFYSLRINIYILVGDFTDPQDSQDHQSGSHGNHQMSEIPSYLQQSQAQQFGSHGIQHYSSEVVQSSDSCVFTEGIFFNFKIQLQFLFIVSNGQTSSQLPQSSSSDVQQTGSLGLQSESFQQMPIGSGNNFLNFLQKQKKMGFLLCLLFYHFFLVL